MKPHRMDRRRFLDGFSAFAAAWASSFTLADELPRVVNPRATSGDQRFEPEWKKRLTITVGPNRGVITGNTDTAIQAAIDYAARLGGDR